MLLGDERCVTTIKTAVQETYLCGQGFNWSATQLFLVSSRNVPPHEDRCTTTLKTAVCNRLDLNFPVHEYALANDNNSNLLSCICEGNEEKTHYFQYLFVCTK